MDAATLDLEASGAAELHIPEEDMEVPVPQVSVGLEELSQIASSPEVEAAITADEVEISLQKVDTSDPFYVMIESLVEDANAFSMEVLQISLEKVQRLQQVVQGIVSSYQEGTLVPNSIESQKTRLQFNKISMCLDILEFYIAKTGAVHVIETISSALLETMRLGVQKGVIGMAQVPLALTLGNLVISVRALRKLDNFEKEVVATPSEIVELDQALKHAFRKNFEPQRRPLSSRSPDTSRTTSKWKRLKTVVQSSSRWSRTRDVVQTGSHVLLCEKLHAFNFRNESHAPQFSLHQDKEKIKQMAQRRKSALQYGNAQGSAKAIKARSCSKKQQLSGFSSLVAGNSS